MYKLHSVGLQAALQGYSKNFYSTMHLTRGHKHIGLDDRNDAEQQRRLTKCFCGHGQDFITAPLLHF